MNDVTPPRLIAGKLHDTIGFKIRMAQILAYRGFEEVLAVQSKAPRYLGLLGVVQAHPGQPQSRLAEAIGLQRSSLVTILDQLEKEGLVERRPSKNDRRANGVWLTKNGHAAFTKLAQAAVAHEEVLIDGLKPHEVETLKRALDRIINNLASTGTGAIPPTGLQQP